MTGSKIINGTPVDAPTTNAALLGRQADDTATGVLTLNNTLDVNSGAQIDNIQNELNSIASFVGKATNVGPAALPTWTSDEGFTPNNPVFDRTDEISSKFPNVTGHSHDPGIPGSGGAILSQSIFSVVLRGSIIRGVDITGATGGSSDVSSQFAGVTPSTSSGQKGAVSTAPYNKVVLRQATGASAGDQFLDALGNEVYGRLTNSGGVNGTWTLTYYVLIGSTETAYSFGSAVNVAFYYQQLFNPITDAPVYSEFAFIPSENATQDVIDASLTQSGKVNTTTQSFAGNKTFRDGIAYTEYADSATTGSSANVPLGSSKWVQLTNSSLVSIATVGTPASGELRVLTNNSGSSVDVLDETGSPSSERILTGTGMTMKLENNSTIILAYDAISSRWRVIGGSGGQPLITFQETPTGTVNGTNPTFGPLTFLPTTADSVLVLLDGIVVPGTDYSISGGTITFGGSSIPQVGQSVYCYYTTGGTPSTPSFSGVWKTEYRTLTGGEATAKQLTLASLPSSASEVLLDVIGGGAQFYSDDFTVSGSVLSWSGLGLDGVLSSGDKLRIGYVN